VKKRGTQTELVDGRTGPDEIRPGPAHTQKVDSKQHVKILVLKISDFEGKLMISDIRLYVVDKEQENTRVDTKGAIVR
jgi:methyl coenzyme M reductase subunit D